MNSAADLKRSKSPISATKASAVSVSMPRRQRSLATGPRHRRCCAASVDRPLERLDPTVDEVDRVHVAVEGLLLGGELEALLAQPLAPRHTPAPPGQSPSPPQAEPRQPLPVTHPIKRVLAGADEIAHRLRLAEGT
jgi:hypothetical protein